MGVWQATRVSLVPVRYPLGPSEMTSEIDPTHRNTSAHRAGRWPLAAIFAGKFQLSLIF